MMVWDRGLLHMTGTCSEINQAITDITISIIVSIIIFYIQLKRQQKLAANWWLITVTVFWLGSSNYVNVSYTSFESRFSGNPLPIAFWLRSSNNLTISSTLGCMICEQPTHDCFWWWLFDCLSTYDCQISKSNNNFWGLRCYNIQYKNVVCEKRQFKQLHILHRKYSQTICMHGLY